MVTVKLYDGVHVYIFDVAITYRTYRVERVKTSAGLLVPGGAHQIQSSLGHTLSFTTRENGSSSYFFMDIQVSSDFVAHSLTPGLFNIDNRWVKFV